MQHSYLKFILTINIKWYKVSINEFYKMNFKNLTNKTVNFIADRLKETLWA